MSVTLITGADGHIGQALTKWLLANSDDQILLFVRAKGREKAIKEGRLRTLAANPRCRLVYGDLVDDTPFSTISTNNVTGILHCAAQTAFSVDRHRANAVNIAGTDKLIKFAQRCRKLQRLGFASSLYTAGLRDGKIFEYPLDNSAPFANYYEWSKYRAEQSLYSQPDIPWQIYRIATILADDESGVVSQQNVIHNTLRLFYYGLLSVFPGLPNTRVYTTTTRFVAEAIGQLFNNGDTQAIYHLSDSGEQAITLGTLVETVYQTFLTDTVFANQRILKPLFCDQRSFETLVNGFGQFDSPVSQAMNSVSPFAPQLFSDKDVRRDNAEKILESLNPHCPIGLVKAATKYVVETRWGHNQTVAAKS